MSTLKVNSLQPANAGSEDYFLGRAWVNFQVDPLAIRGDGNVSTITDNGVGNYTVNMSSALQDANYSAVQAASNPISSHHVHGYLANGGAQTGTYTSSACQMTYHRDESSANVADPLFVCWQVMR